MDDGMSMEQSFAAAPLPGGRLLVVDDDEVVLTVLQRGLERMGHRVRAFSTPGDALQCFAAQPREFDLVLTDQMMPEMLGRDLARAVKKIREDIPVVLLTAYDAEPGEDSEVCPFAMELHKPIEVPALDRLLRGLLV